MEEHRRRTSSRVVLLDEHDRVLMIKVRDDAIVVPDSPVPPEFWILVGGGVEWGESWEEAARREVFEETGIGDELDLGPSLWERQVDVIWSGEPVQVIERYFLGRIAKASVAFDNLEASERLAFRKHRWWSLDEMREAPPRECFRPPDLIERLTSLL